MILFFPKVGYVSSLEGTHIWLVLMVNVGKYTTIHGSYGKKDHPHVKLTPGSSAKSLERVFHNPDPYLEDHPRTRKRLVTMVIVSPLAGVVGPLQMAFLWRYK